MQDTTFGTGSVSVTKSGRSLVYKLAVRLFMTWPFAKKSVAVRRFMMWPFAKKMIGRSPVD